MSTIQSLHPHPFVRATRVEPTETSGVYAARVPTGWEQGPGAYGGVVVGLALRAIRAELPDAPPLRALTAEIPSPLRPDAPTEVRVEVLRRGRSLSSVEARIVQADPTTGDRSLVARATGLYGATRDVAAPWSDPPPEHVTMRSGDWCADAPVPSERLPPPFVQHLEMRPTVGMPFSGGDVPRVEGWVRFREAPAAIGESELVALADSYYPAFFATMSAPRPAATVSFALHTTPAAEGLDPAEPLYFRSHSPQQGAGYSFERRELWTARGELVAINPQTFVIIK